MSYRNLWLTKCPPSDSDYWATLNVVNKSNSLRLCPVDRRFNEVTKVDPVSLPNADDLLLQVSGAKSFSKLDLTKEYCQVPMKESSK